MKKDILLYRTTTLSNSHKNFGTFQKKDFGKITLTAPEKIQSLIQMKEGEKEKTNICLYKNKYYIDSSFPLGGIDKEFIRSQGHYTPKLAIRTMITLRNRYEQCGWAANEGYLLFKKRLYREWCPKNKLSITETGNTLFGDWWSIDIEPYHINKSNIPFSISSLKKLVKRRVKQFKDTKINLFFPTIKVIKIKAE
jgi:hypothetical protein